MEKQYLPITNTQELTEAMARCQAAQKKFAEYTQTEHINRQRIQRNSFFMDLSSSLYSLTIL